MANHLDTPCGSLKGNANSGIAQGDKLGIFMTRRDPLRRLRNLWISFSMYSGVHQIPCRHMLDAICANGLQGFFQYDFQSSNSPLTGSRLSLWLVVRTHTLIPQVSEADPYVPQTANQSAHLHSNQTPLLLCSTRTCRTGVPSRLLVAI